MKVLDVMDHVWIRVMLDPPPNEIREERKTENLKSCQWCVAVLICPEDFGDTFCPQPNFYYLSSPGWCLFVSVLGVGKDRVVLNLFVRSEKTKSLRPRWEWLQAPAHTPCMRFQGSGVRYLSNVSQPYAQTTPWQVITWNKRKGIYHPTLFSYAFRWSWIKISINR